MLRATKQNVLHPECKACVALLSKVISKQTRKRNPVTNIGAVTNPIPRIGTELKQTKKLVAVI